MLRRFLPRQEGFFELFQKNADMLVLTAQTFKELTYNLTDQQKYVDEINKLELKGDQISNATFKLLHKTFITPFDRHDIHRLVTGIDDCIDLINRLSQRFPYYALTTLPKELLSLTNVCVEACQLLKMAIYQLHSIENSDEIFAACHKIDDLEGKAHQFVLSGEKELFLHENDFKQFYKLKEIYSRIKLVIDECQDVANAIKGIVLEYS